MAKLLRGVWGVGRAPEHKFSFFLFATDGLRGTLSPSPPLRPKEGGGVLRNRFHPYPLRAQRVGVGEKSCLGLAARKTDCSAVLTFRMGSGGEGGLGGGGGGGFRVRRGWWVSPRV